MIIAIAANPQQKIALEKKSFKDGIDVRWVCSSIELHRNTDADALIDCLFDSISFSIADKPLLIHSPIKTLASLNAKGMIARFCAWNSFAEKKIWEMAVQEEDNAAWLSTLMEVLGWQYQVVKDKPGLVAPRIISMLINEAYYALEDQVSSIADIDTAMKLGTNYPFGPFEWAAIIGVENVYLLLNKLSETDKRYRPATLLGVQV